MEDTPRNANKPERRTPALHVQRQRSARVESRRQSDESLPVLSESLSNPTRERLTRSDEFCGKRVHLIGIGGSGMSGAASMLLALGAEVSGSDATAFEGMGALVARGAHVTVGHDKALMSHPIDLVVVSAAIPDENPELIEARRRGLCVIKYAQFIGRLMDRRKGVAIAGTHGKTTTTAMCSYVFGQAGLDPSFVCGAPCDQLNGSSGIGTGPHFIVEACEYDRSFLHFQPDSAAILNIEPDHLDCYRDLDDIVDTFTRFARQVHPEGLVVCSAEDVQAKKAAGQALAQVQTVGFEKEADWQAVGLESDYGRYRFDVRFHGSVLLSTGLALPGRHNVSNALAVVALAHHAGIDPSRIAEALASFAGVQRRMNFRGTRAGITIVDDYAHHPTEIRVTIEAARYRYRPKRTWVVFQPHQAARTRHLMDEFARSFTLADEIIVPDIYGAREQASGEEPAGSKELVSRICSRGGRAHYLPTLQAAAAHVADRVTDGDLVVTMGAGDVWKVADELVERLC